MNQNITYKYYAQHGHTFPRCDIASTPKLKDQFFCFKTVLNLDISHEHSDFLISIDLSIYEICGERI